MMRLLLPACLNLLFMMGCTTEAWYTSVKNSAELRCQKLPQAAYADCMAQANTKSYQQYKRDTSESLSSGK